MTNVKTYISPFLAEKKLALNSRKSYQYDLEQFCQQVGDKIDDYSLRLYQESLASLKPSAKKRKVSSVNQFLYFLYENGAVEQFYKIKLLDDRTPVQTNIGSILDLTSFYEQTHFRAGQLIALLFLELGLTPSELADLKVSRIDRDFQVVTVKRAGVVRVLPIPDRLLPFLKWEDSQVYLFDRQGQTYSRQWFFTQLSSFLAERGLPDLTASKLREQYILREEKTGLSIVDLAKKLGLKKTTTLEKYYRHGH